MREDVIAANRFGLGLRAGERLPRDGRGWLIDQFGRYQARPQPIAALPGREAIAGALGEYRETAKAARQAKRARGEAMPEASSDAPMMSQPPQRAAANPGMADRRAMRQARRADETPEQAIRREERRDLRQIYQNAVAARAEVALTTETPFVERLVHFWSNHFAVSVEKIPVAAFAGNFEAEAIRPHALGRFGDMLNAVERHPAMLVFLDQVQSIGPGTVAAQRVAARANRQRGLNENLAREIMELHTLGVRTGYGQDDVTEFARALTGWNASGIGRGGGRRRGLAEIEQGSFVFVPAFHEPGARTILGKRFTEGGEQQGQAVLDMLATHPATARHIAIKLAVHFAGDTPPPTLVARLEAAFLRSGGDLPTVYRALIEAPEPWAVAAPKFKTPWDWAISASRAIGARSFPAQNAAGFVGQLGQPIWRPGSPAGFDDIAASWAGPDAVMRRVEASERLAARFAADGDARASAAALFGDTLSPATGTAIARAESPAQGMALLLVSPEFMRR